MARLPKWLSFLGGGTDAVLPPKLDPPDVTAKRVEKKRKADLARWRALTAEGPLPEKITRAGVEKVLRDAGYTKHRGSPDSYFSKRQGANEFELFVSLKTFGDGEFYAPNQRLNVTASVTTQAFREAYGEILGDPSTSHAPIASLGQQRFQDFVLTHAAVHEILQQVEADLSALDLEAELTKFRAFDPSHPGNGGVRHLAALSLAGQIDTLDGYVRRRQEGDPCGFVPFISDDMIARAAAIGHRHR